MNDNEKNTAYQNGWDAYWKGTDFDSNPYHDEELREKWSVGWLTAQDADKHGL